MHSSGFEQRDDRVEQFMLVSTGRESWPEPVRRGCHRSTDRGRGEVSGFQSLAGMSHPSAAAPDSERRVLEGHAQGITESPFQCQLV